MVPLFWLFIIALLEAEKDIAKYTAQFLKRKNGTLHWFVDEEADSKLKK